LSRSWTQGYRVRLQAKHCDDLSVEEEMRSPEDKIREVSPAWGWRPPRIFTDPIDMDYRLSDLIQQELTVVRLETYGQVARSLAEGYTKAAQLIARGKTAG
jgi:hypothetical protein